jgi:glycosyltransferase involved in cell wall biosynthesis
MADKLISVVVPVYNGELYLGAALESIFAQDYRPIEIVVVDDGSTDGTAAIAMSYPGVWLIRQKNQGPAVARNTGLANSSGTLISFLDADDYWQPKKLRVQSDYLTAHPEMGCVIGKVHNFLEDGRDLPGWISEAMMTEDGGGWNLGASLIQRWAFDRIGSFNVMYPLCDDLEWVVRLTEAGIPVGLVGDIFLRRRIHTTNISRNQNALARARVRLLKEHMDRRRSISNGEPAR